MTTCSVSGCDQPRHAREMCRRHYMRVSRYGTPNLLNTAPPLTREERLERKREDMRRRRAKARRATTQTTEKRPMPNHAGHSRHYASGRVERIVATSPQYGPRMAHEMTATDHLRHERWRRTHERRTVSIDDRRAEMERELGRPTVFRLRAPSDPSDLGGAVWESGR